MSSIDATRKSRAIRRLLRRRIREYPPRCQASPTGAAIAGCGDGFTSTFFKSSFALHFPKRVKSFWIPSAVSHERSSPRSGALAWVRVVEELGRTVDALGRFDDVGAHHFATLGLSDPHHHEVRDRRERMSSTWYDCFTKRIVSSTRAGPGGRLRRRFATFPRFARRIPA